jgi:aminocarboxymuconate-semialdehyde decarboxylase
MDEAPEIIDVFCHWLPEEYLALVDRLKACNLHMFLRARNIPVMVSLDARFRVMDEFPGYRQIPSLASPSVEMLATADRSPDLARRANEMMAEIVSRHPDRFAGFVAALPLNNPEASVAEIERALTTLGASGFQLFTSVDGLPLDNPVFEPLFACAAERECPLWLHPIGGPGHADYVGEESSKYDIWWALGWPHETAKAMARLVFSGLFTRHPDIKIITHHAGGTIPMLEGRLDSGMNVSLSRTPHTNRSSPPISYPEPPIQSFRRFYADTATFGAAAPLECGLTFFGPQNILFASDMPFDPEGGPGYIRSTLQALERMSLSREEMRLILTDNFRKIVANGVVS